jgi:hypothetical protein
MSERRAWAEARNGASNWLDAAVGTLMSDQPVWWEVVGGGVLVVRASRWVTRTAVIAIAVLMVLGPEISGGGLRMEATAPANAAGASGSPVPDLWSGATAYDAVDGFVLLWGAAGDSGSWNHTQTWTFVRGEWTQLQTSDSPPETAYAPLLAYDAADGYVLLYETVGDSHSITWTFGHGVWTNVSGSLRTPPPYIGGGGMAYDPAIRAVVLLGEANADYNWQTWAFSADQWTNESTAPAPSAPLTSLIGWDVTQNALVFVSWNDQQFLSNRSGVYCSGTWLYRASGWNRTSLPTPCDEGLGSVMAFDQGSNEMVLLGTGGSANCNAIPCNATWFLGPAGWNYRSLQPNPPMTFPGLSSMSYDAADGYLVVYGGRTIQGTTTQLTDRTWTYQNATWAELPLPPSSPAPVSLLPYVAVGAVIVAVVLGVGLWWRRWKALSSKYEPSARDLPPSPPG